MNPLLKKLNDMNKEINIEVTLDCKDIEYQYFDSMKSYILLT